MWKSIFKKKFLNSPGYVGGFVIFLTVLQIRALVYQFKSGFMPFVKEPTRVSFSWDMFATKTERCLLAWEPALQFTPVGKLKSLEQLFLPLEWSVVYDSVRDYTLAAQYGCRSERTRPIRVKLRCFLSDGNEMDRDFYCS